MTTFSSLRLALAAGLAAPLALATASLAQPSSPPGPPPAGEMRQRPDPAEMRAHMTDHLRAILQLQPGQDGALNAFLDALKPPAGDHDRMRGEREAAEPMTTPERLDKMLARMDERRGRFAQIAAATKTFYAQLSPAQQRAFDALPMGQGMGHGDMEHHEMDGGPDGGWRGDHGGPREMGPDGQPHG